MKTLHAPDTAAAWIEAATTAAQSNPVAVWIAAVVLAAAAAALAARWL